MKKIDKDLDNILSLEEKKRLLKDIGQEDLLEIFKDNYKVKYTPPVNKKSPLDQQVALSISKEEREQLSQELFLTRREGTNISISAYVRHQVTSHIDLKDWSERALNELNRLNSKGFDKNFITKQKGTLVKLLDEAQDDEEYTQYEKDLAELNSRLDYMKKKSFKRKYRLSGRVTFREAQSIRWKAARLNLSIADFLRYVMFGYKPGGEADLNLSFEDRKRFYISILDVYRNGWGEPENTSDCPDCIRYQKEIEILKEQLNRYKKYAQKGGI